ncbi:MAG: hypothetical protein ACJAR1_002685 [Rubritalea sp.]|jgi:hypothetical protein
MSLSEDLLVKQLAHLPRAMQLTTNAANLALLFCSFPNQLCCHFKSFHKRSIQYNGEDGISPDPIANLKEGKLGRGLGSSIEDSRIVSSKEICTEVYDHIQLSSNSSE